MWKFILKRVGYMRLTLFAVVSITVLLVHSIPGDPFTSMVEDLPEETRQLYMERYGFDQPLGVKYIKYIRQLLQGIWALPFAIRAGRLSRSCSSTRRHL